MQKLRNYVKFSPRAINYLTFPRRSRAHDS